MTSPLLVLSALAAVLFVLLLAAVRAWRRARAALADERSRRSRQAARHGRATEQFAPFMADYPHDPAGFRFLGSPVDGVQFTDDGVVFVEFKAGRSDLSARQRRVRDLIEAGKVDWLEFRVEE